jgi:hypothetical protein
MSLIKQPHELETNIPISCLIYGQPGVGKTSLALSSPKPLLLDLDRGLHRVEKRYQCPSVQVTDYRHVTDVLASSEINEFETIVIDTLGKLIDSLGDSICSRDPKLRQNDGTFSLRAWGVIKTNFQELLRRLLKLNKHIIFISHEKEEKIDDKIISRPDISGSSGKDIVKELDLMGYMQIVNKKRTISFSPDDKYYAKNSLGLEPVIEIPSIQNGNTFFKDKILVEIEAKKQKDLELTRRYEELKRSQEEKIEHIKTVDDMNMIFVNLNQEDKLWDSEICWKKYLYEKSKSLGATFNKDAGKFESDDGDSEQSSQYERGKYERGNQSPSSVTASLVHSVITNVG